MYRNMDKRKKAMTLLLQIRDLKKKLSEWYKYDKSLSIVSNQELQRKFVKDLKDQIDEKNKIAKDLIKEIKYEEKKVDTKMEPKKPTWNVREQVNNIVKNRSLYIK